MHSRNFIHRDIKPDHFLLGMGTCSGQISIVDFGFAKQYRDPDTYLHIPYSNKNSLVGTDLYCSINTHLGIEQTRRDDLESLAYILIYFLRGSLPWHGLESATATQNNQRIMNEKKSTPTDVLCCNLPEEFGIFLNYARNLGFDEKPDYSYVRELFCALGAREGYQYDGIFDWSASQEDSCDSEGCNGRTGTTDFVSRGKVTRESNYISDRRYEPFSQCLTPPVLMTLCQASLPYS